MDVIRRIFEIPEKNVEHIKQTQGLVESFPGYVLRMRGLPYSATADNVVRFPIVAAYHTMTIFESSRCSA